MSPTWASRQFGATCECPIGVHLCIFRLIISISFAFVLGGSLLASYQTHHWAGVVCRTLHGGMFTVAPAVEGVANQPSPWFDLSFAGATHILVSIMAIGTILGEAAVS